MDLEMVIAEYVDLGITDYSKTFELQKELAEKRDKDEIPDTILISEHYPTINFGNRAVHNTFSTEFLQEMQEKGIELTEENAIIYLKKKGIDFSRTSRGGGATYIGEGQINIYPIVKYERIVNSLMGVNKYKELIDLIMYGVLKSYNLDVKIHKDSRNEDENSKRSNRRDIWIEKEGKPLKLGGKGIHTSKGVAYHGFNFYVKRGSTDGFRYVNACGYSPEQLGVITLEEALGNKVSIEDFKSRVLNEIKNRFGYKKISKSEK